MYNHAGEGAASGGRLGRGGAPKYLPGELRMALAPPQDPLTDWGRWAISLGFGVHGPGAASLAPRLLERRGGSN